MDEWNDRELDRAPESAWNNNANTNAPAEGDVTREAAPMDSQTTPTNDFHSAEGGAQTSAAETDTQSAFTNDAAENAQPHEQQWAYAYNRSTAGDEQHAVKHTPHKKSGRAGLAIVMVLCILFSGLAGFGGTWLANRLNADNVPVSTGDGSSTTVTNQTVSYIKGEEGLTRVQLAAKVSPTVVQITTEYTTENYWLQTTTATGAGSGVIISADGTIITNNHVIDKATSIKVTLSNGDVYDAALVATDEQTDIAVLKIEASDLAYATVGDSDNLVVGQDVIAVGNPLGELGGTVTSGIISAVNRQITVENTTMTLIQTNTAINPGNSGGGLFDAEGNLIGIVNAKYSEAGVEGLGFAIPINTAMKSAQDLISVGYVTGRVSVGLNLLGINDQQTAFQYRVNRLGVYVYSTAEDSSAAKAGFRTGDYIESIDGTEVSTVDEIKTIFSKHEIGDTVTVHVLRNEEELDLQLVLTEYAPSDSNS